MIDILIPPTTHRRSWRFFSILAGGQDVSRGVGDHICRALCIGPADVEDPELLALEAPAGAAGGFVVVWVDVRPGRSPDPAGRWPD